MDWNDFLVVVKAMFVFSLMCGVLFGFAATMAYYYPMPEPVDRYDEGFSAGFAAHNETVNSYAQDYCEYITTLRGVDKWNDENFTYYNGYHAGYLKWRVGA